MDVKPDFSAPLSAVWLNTLWFSSLVCSLSSASIALLVKQWLQEARDGLSGTSRECARLRQHRLNGLVKWRIDIIVAALPILLQIALGTFFAGMLILLWTLNTTVAAVTSEEEYTFDSLVAWFRAVYCVLLCILRASPNDTLS